MSRVPKKEKGRERGDALNETQKRGSAKEILKT